MWLERSGTGVRVLAEGFSQAQGGASMTLEAIPSSPYAVEAVLEALAYLRHRFSGTPTPWPDRGTLEGAVRERLKEPGVWRMALEENRLTRVLIEVASNVLEGGRVRVVLHAGRSHV